MITHISKTGAQLKSIKGYTVKEGECPGFYRALEKIYRRVEHGTGNRTKQQGRVA